MKIKTNISGNIFLIGPMGAGKTTVGRQLAAVLGRLFIDSDQEIEDRAGATIPLIFKLEGEAGFRKREHEVIDELTRQQCIVLATGGGVVLNADSRSRLMERGHVIYLHASADQLLKRTRGSKNRPLLQTANPRQRIEEILKERVPIYFDTADVVIKTGRRSVRQVVKKIIKQLQKLQESLAKANENSQC
ncbi:MAG: shikimate kinase AroK [Gammaproteobacteria bacterium]|nr:shikimate kinase AroK [Gammaproteobacteria bacterium]